MTRWFYAHLLLFVLPTISCALAVDNTVLLPDSLSLDSAIVQNDSSAVSVEEDSLPPIEKMPVLEAFVAAEYADSLIAQGVEGKVVMDLLVNDSGSVDSIVIVKGLHPVLDRTAQKAAKQFHFSPAIAGGEPVPVFLTYEYLFTLEDVMKKIEEYVNVSGRIIEKGTRILLVDALVVISFPGKRDTAISDGKKEIALAPGNIPFDRYLEKIGSFQGQYYEEGSIVTTTDSAGTFQFKSIPPGEVVIKVVATACKPFEDELDIFPDEKVEVKYRVERSDYNEYEIVVYYKPDAKEVSRRVMKTYEAKRVPGTGGDVVKAVQALPGVARPVFGGTEIVIRGADWDDNKYFIDGIPIPYLWHDLGQASVLNSNLVDNIVLYPGGYGVRFGDVLGGVIEVDPRTAKEDRWHCIADMNLSNSSLVLEIPFHEKFSFIGSARREYSVSVATWIAEKWFNQHVGFNAYYWDYSLRMDFKPTKEHVLFAEYIAAKDTMYEIDIREDGSVEEEGEGFNFGKNFKLAIAGWDWKISDKFDNSFRYGFAPLDMKIEEVYTDVDSRFRISGVSHTIRDDLKYTLNSKFAATLGLDMHLEPTEMKRKYTGTYWNDNNEKVDTSFSEDIDCFLGPIGAYLSCEVKPRENFTLIPAYRLDYYPELNYHGSLLPEFWDYDFDNDIRWSYEPSFRLSARYDINPKHSIKGALGTYNKSPQYNANNKWGNPHLAPARGAQYTLGHEWQITDLISIDVQGYLNWQWNKAVYIWGEELKAGETAGFAERGKARMRGLEFFLRHGQGQRFFGWLSYTLSYSERYDHREKEWAIFDRNILNNIQLVASWNLRRNKVIGLRLQYTDGYPYTPADGVLYYDASNFYYVPDWGKKNSAKHTPFIGLDFRFEKKMAFKNSLFTFYIGCDRLLHFLQFIKKDDGTPLYFPTEFPSYNYDYSKFEGFANFPAPTFGLSVEF